MAVKFLNGINLGTTELQNAVIHNVPTASIPTGVVGQILYDSTTDELKYYDGQWRVVTNTTNAAVDYISGGSFNTGNGELTLTGVGGAGAVIDLDGRYLQTEEPAFQTIRVSGQSDVVADTSTDTLTLIAGSNIGITTNASLDEIEIASADSYVTAASFATATGILTLTVSGQSNVTVDLDGRYLESYTETQTLDDVTTLGATTTNAITVGGLTVNGNLTVSGAVDTKVSETLLVEDALFVLNSNETGAATNDAGFVIERGTDTNVMFVWDESADQFIFATTTETGSTAGNAVVSDYASFRAGGATFDDAVTLSTVANAAADTDKFLVIDGSGVVKHRTGAEVASDIGVTSYVTAREYVATIGDGVATSIDVIHGLDSRDVIVQLFDASTYDTVHADVVRSQTDRVNISFAEAPTNNDIRVLITKVG